ncbi:hypothetical protein [Nocardia asteroides]|uniref:hypothetical protein n=1 Tax=Nocardia asteroides TaxID=1824 RepID=UPI001E3D1B8E|nr:hypothetical protein [Nocardia asteroides]UGT59631.1 hypothetical protein LTT61_20595 [Nocardia asteroides]
MKRFLAALSGILLAVSVWVVEPWFALAVLALAAIGLWFRVAAVAAVLVAVGLVAVADVDLVVCAAAGLVATTYLLNSATVTAPAGVVPTTIPSVVGALFFSGCAVLAASVPLDIPYAPLAAPVLILVLCALVLLGVAVRRNGSRSEPALPPSPELNPAPAAATSVEADSEP